MRKALVKDGFVLNVIEVEKDSSWQVPAGHILINARNSEKGDIWNGKNFITPEPESTIDYKALWKETKTPAEKLAVLGKMLKLEEPKEEVYEDK